jgi:sugar-specific transcriptional regulator TrmB
VQKLHTCYAYGMLSDTGAVRNYFAKLGLGQEIADIYLSLYANGPQTISALSRSSGIERTRIYRLIDNLLDSNLVELEMQNKRGLIKAAPISNLRVLINQREQELKSLTDELELMEQVLSRNSLSHATTRTQFFVGIEGIRQLLQQEYAATTDITGYEPTDIKTLIGAKFWDEHAAELKKRHIMQRFLASPNGVTHACHIYNDVTTYILADGELYGLQVRDSGIAAALRQFIR